MYNCERAVPKVPIGNLRIPLMLRPGVAVLGDLALQVQKQ